MTIAATIAPSSHRGPNDSDSGYAAYSPATASTPTSAGHRGSGRSSSRSVGRIVTRGCSGASRMRLILPRGSSGDHLGNDLSTVDRCPFAPAVVGVGELQVVQAHQVED